MNARYVRYRTPTENGEKLCVPSWDRLGKLLTDNTGQRASYAVQIASQPLAVLAEQARTALLDDALTYTRGYADPQARAGEMGPVIVGGHQPELSHPGVWLKDFAAAQMAKVYGGTAIHLIIDSDVCRGPSIRVPTGTVAVPRVETVALDQSTDDLPYEERRIVDFETWQGFSRRVERTLGPLVANPWIQSWWPEVIAHSKACPTLGLALSQARHRTQLDWNCESLELPLSRVCQTTPFRRFVIHLLDNMVAFHDAYNASLHEFRGQHRIRNAAQPMPDLGAFDDWLETPFWIWSTEDPRRRALFVKSDGNGWRIADRNGFQRSVSRTSTDVDQMVGILAEWEGQGIKIRPRALLTTMYARLFLADLFIHGIGGARYDQVTDAISERFFGLAPPGHATLSGTLRLPLEASATQTENPSDIQRQLRELTFHPEAYLDLSGYNGEEQARIAGVVQKKKEWIADPKTLAGAQHRHNQIVLANESMQPWLATQRAALRRALAVARQQTRSDSILHSREYAFCLFPRELLQEFLLDFSGSMP